ncbi:MAG TPA: DUF1152 domain-containing protein [Solirubrobacterales bacterium]|nr:DUF1152 domain-containing protein [Solirubrobacterales bacterium]
MRDSNRALLIGMGGGGDVVGALGVSKLLDELGTEWTLGGVAWERAPIDPRPGPRSLEEIRDGRPCGSAAVLTEGGTTNLDGVEFSESKMATHLGRPVLLLDITRGPAALAKGLAEAAGELGCDAVVLLDVGGDVLAHGDEPGLASPLCDAVVLAAALILARTGERAGAAWSGEPIAAVYGPGCDGELTPGEVLERITELQSAGALLGAWGLTPEAADLVEGAARTVPTEASLMAVRCARGERGTVPIRGGRRTVEVTSLGALTFFFDPVAAATSAIPLAKAVSAAASLEEAHEALMSMGVRTELDLERARYQH